LIPAKQTYYQKSGNLVIKKQKENKKKKGKKKQKLIDTVCETGNPTFLLYYNLESDMS